MVLDAAAPAVVWHDLECGAYRADFALWRELADAHPDGPILDVGAGSGRVALELARRGRRVIAVDIDALLLGALRERAGRLDVETMCADARSFELPHGERLALCIVPMQTVQLLGGEDARMAFLRRARAHLLPGGLLACAIVTDLETFDCARGPGPAPERCRAGGTLYTSRPTRVQVRSRTIEIERERRIGRSDTIERDLIELDRLTVGELEQEGIAAGFRPEPVRHIAVTADHAGSEVVMLRA